MARYVPPRKLTQEQQSEMAQRYANGEQPRELAARFGCSRWTVLDTARRHGVQIHPRGNRYREFTAAEVVGIQRRRLEGASDSQIARSLGISQSVMSHAMARRGFPAPARKSGGPTHSQWKGGRVTLGSRYIGIWLPPGHEFAAMQQRAGYVAEHRLVMAQALGRVLEPHETVHHINGDKTDNRLENLQLRTGRHGNGVVMVCLDCGSHNVAARPLGGG